MTLATETPGTTLPSEELAVAAALDVIATETRSDVHRLTIQALLAAAGEQGALAEHDLPNREELAEALLTLRSHRLVTLHDEGFRLTQSGHDIAAKEVPDAFRAQLLGLLRRKMLEWQSPAAAG